MICIKPHHFVDILKLYGAGIYPFVPDAAYGHDFYAVANTLVENPGTQLCLTSGADDICAPCRHLDAALAVCTDALATIPGYTGKEQWNNTLDTRLMAALEVEEGTVLSAGALCGRLQAQEGLIEAVWREEQNEKTADRRRLFDLGTRRFLQA